MEMTDEELKKHVFKPVLKRLNERKESLSHLKRFLGEGKGIEAWLKVEVLAALETKKVKVADFYGKGADLKLSNGQRIELKAATDFNPRHIVKDGAEKHKAPCLFLADGRDDEPRSKKLRKNRIQRFEKLHAKLVDEQKLDCGNGCKWIVGLVRPPRKS